MVVVSSQPIPEGFPDAFHSWYLRASAKTRFEDYSEVVATRFDSERKAKRRMDVLPRDCEKAYAMGVRFAKAGAKR
jgi:hypothetical protein